MPTRKNATTAATRTVLRHVRDRLNELERLCGAATPHGLIASAVAELRGEIEERIGEPHRMELPGAKKKKFGVHRRGTVR